MPPSCFLVQDASLAEVAAKYIKSSERGLIIDKNHIVHLKFWSSPLECPTVLERVMHLCRETNVLSKWNVLHLSETEALKVIQLCIGEKAKQECGEFYVQASDVLAVHQRLVNDAIYGEVSTSDPIDSSLYTQYIQDNHLIDSAGVLLKLKEMVAKGHHRPGADPVIIHGTPSCQLERYMAAVMFGEEVVEIRRAVSDLNGSIAIKDEAAGVEGEEEQVDHVETLWHCVEVEALTIKLTRTDQHVQSMFCSLLRILVNTRDELALAAACQAPGLQLQAAQFLALRRAARSRAMPMYQTMVSHVRRVELGGRNYQAPADCPLHACTVALASLVHLVQRMQDIIEEDADARKCCQRLLSTAKSYILKDSKLSSCAVERVAQKIHQTVASVFNDYGTSEDPSVIGGHTVKMVRDICDRLSCSSPPATDHLSVLEDATTTPTTPGRNPITLPSIVSLFRSPVDMDEDSADLLLEKRLHKKGVFRTDTPTTTKRSSGYDEPPIDPDTRQFTPSQVTGPTLVCSRFCASAPKYVPGAGVRAFQELQIADRAKQQEAQQSSPKTSKPTRQPKRALFHASKQVKKIKTDASEDQENVQNPEIRTKSQQGTRKNTKRREIRQVQGQKSIKDFFRF